MLYFNLHNTGLKTMGFFSKMYSIFNFKTRDLTKILIAKLLAVLFSLS